MLNNFTIAIEAENIKNNARFPCNGLFIMNCYIITILNYTLDFNLYIGSLRLTNPLQQRISSASKAQIVPNVLILADPSLGRFRVSGFKTFHDFNDLILITHPDLYRLAGRVPNHLLAPCFFDDINRYIGYPLLGQ
ncbi:hypothetical protein D1872_283900 [compost metagenome]